SEYPLPVILLVRTNIGPLRVALFAAVHDSNPAVLEQRLGGLALPPLSIPRDLLGVLFQPVIVVALTIRQCELEWGFFRRELGWVVAVAGLRVINASKVFRPLVVPVRAIVGYVSVFLVGWLTDPEARGPCPLHGGSRYGTAHNSPSNSRFLTRGREWQ